MKSSTIIILAIFLLTSISKSFAKFENNIILKVENEIITNFEIKNKIISSLILGNQEINQNNIDKLKKKSVELLIEDKLKIIELKKYNIKICICKYKLIFLDDISINPI